MNNSTCRVYYAVQCVKRTIIVRILKMKGFPQQVLDDDPVRHDIFASGLWEICIDSSKRGDSSQSPCLSRQRSADGHTE